MQVSPGRPLPLGAHWDGRGVNVAVFAEHAEAVELCLFDAPSGCAESLRVALPSRTGAVWHGYLPDLRPGQLYGFRVHGPWAPGAGQRFNPHKLLIDPCARALTVHEHAVAGASAGETLHAHDSAPFVAKSVVVDASFDWGHDRPPETPWNRTTIYEAHVRALTMRHPHVPPELRGTYLGLASPPIVAHLLSLGVTAVELLPVQHFLSEEALLARGLVNAWGYNPLAFSAPHAQYATRDRGQQVVEFKTMVKALHEAGLEVLLDVVYNHTAEGDERGPTLALKGFDNPAYYHLRPGDRGRYVDFTGCGNSVDAGSEAGRQLVLSSLRSWVEEFHVDGFRFDLAPVLGRDSHGGQSDAIWRAMLADPVLARVKLIAEPWDLGPDGDRTGRMPAGIAQWNGRFRDGVRRFWRGDRGQLAELAFRLSGSSDLFPSPASSINFVTCHDGFTLADLVAYERKHNEANGEGNRDGTDANWSRNWGVEGPTDDARLVALRDRVARSLLATTLLAQGVPMLLAGDELGRTQAGNNNAYCQDSELTWIDWQLDARRAALLEFTRRTLALVRAHPVLRRSSFFTGLAVETPEGADPAAGKDVTWLRPDGREPTHHDWHGEGQALGMLLPGRHAESSGRAAHEPPAETLLLVLNAGAAELDFALPPGSWEMLLDSSQAEAPLAAPVSTLRALVPAHSLLLLRLS